MGIYIASQVIKLMIKKGQKVDGAKVLILGITFKEDCPDIRNSKVIDVIHELTDFGTQVDIYDPWAKVHEVKNEYGLDLLSKENLPNFEDYQAIVLAVSHAQFKHLVLKKSDKQVIYDVKGFLIESDEKL